jgi:hypothetical protein
MKKKALTLAKSIPAEILNILGPPPILSTEDENLYYETLARFARDIAPTDTITWLLIKDLVDYRIEIARCRRFKAAVIKQAYQARISAAIKNHRLALDTELKALRAALDADHLKELRTPPYDTKRIDAHKAQIEARFEKETAAKKEQCEKTIKACEELLPGEKDMVTTFDDWIANHNRIDQILETAEQKFFATLREIERHIFGFAKALREELKIIEGEVLERIEVQPESA